MKKQIGLIAMLLGAVAVHGNLLMNGDFESGVDGWTTFNGAGASAATVQSGSGSLLLDGPGGGFSVPGAFQTVAANPGDVFNFQGYMTTNTVLPGDITFGVLKVVWGNGTNDLQPLTAGNDPFLIGSINTANPGIESTPTLNVGSGAGSWVFTQAQATAPAGTTEVKFFALLVNQSGATIYADNLVATQVPEPATFAAVFGLLALGFVAYRRRKA